MKKSQSITLKVFPYKDSSKIVNLFTKDFGLISVIIYGIGKKMNNLQAICNLFTQSEIIIQESHSDLFILKDTSIIDQNLHLRNNFTDLKIAGKISKAVLDSNLPFNKSKPLFLLLEKFLKNISINPLAIYSSFLLKLLLIEGLINPKINCHICQNKAQNISFAESVCEKHSDQHSFRFTKDEFDILHLLTFIKSFSLFKAIEITSTFEDKINLLFKSLI